MTADPGQLTLAASDDPSHECFRRLGEIAAIMLQSRIHCGYQIAALAVWAEPALILEQVAIAYDKSGTPFCYVSWALVSDDVFERLRTDPKTMLHISEWNEGDRLWLIDFACRQGHAAKAAKFLANSVFNDHIAATYRRLGRVRTLRTFPKSSPPC